MCTNTTVQPEMRMHIKQCADQHANMHALSNKQGERALHICRTTHRLPSSDILRRHMRIRQIRECTDAKEGTGSIPMLNLGPCIRVTAAKEVFRSSLPPGSQICITC